MQLWRSSWFAAHRCRVVGRGTGQESDSNLAGNSCCRHGRYSVPAKYKGTDGHHVVLPARNGRDIVACVPV
jgi:hypothetical protein